MKKWRNTTFKFKELFFYFYFIFVKSYCLLIYLMTLIYTSQLFFKLFFFFLKLNICFIITCVCSGAFYVGHDLIKGTWFMKFSNHNTTIGIYPEKGRIYYNYKSYMRKLDVGPDHHFQMVPPFAVNGLCQRCHRPFALYYWLELGGGEWRLGQPNMLSFDHFGPSQLEAHVTRIDLRLWMKAYLIGKGHINVHYSSLSR